MRKTKKTKVIRLPRSIKKLFPKVEFAYDSDQAVDVDVQPRDCKGAEPLNPSECALARATKREFNCDGAVIGMSSSYIIKGNKAFRFATPVSVQKEIVSFDRHSDFSVGSYHLPPKPPTARFGAKDTHAGGGKNKNAKRKFHTSARVRVLARGVSKGTE